MNRLKNWVWVIRAIKTTALLDANVLYPAPLRDLLLHLSLNGLFHAKWSNDIHDEWIRNVLKNRPDLKPEQLERTRVLMNIAIQDCLITDYEQLIPALDLPDPGDRHVLAAAIIGKVDVIISSNLKDFPRETLAVYGIEIEQPDSFISELIKNEPGLAL